MLFLSRRSFESDNSKAKHKQSLSAEAKKLLKQGLEEKNIFFSEDLIDYTEHGKPYLKGYDKVFFNISHCREIAVCAIEDTVVGVDVENIRQRLKRVMQRTYSEREIEYVECSENPDEMFFRIWTLKESFVKALGIGISYPMNTAEFFPDEEKILHFGCDGYTFSQIIINQNFVCSLCVKKESESIVLRTETDNDHLCFDL